MPTRRSFLKLVTAVLAAPSAAPVTKQAPEAAGHYGTSFFTSPEYLEAQRLHNALMRDKLDAAHLACNPPIYVASTKPVSREELLRLHPRLSDD